MSQPLASYIELANVAACHKAWSMLVAAGWSIWYRGLPQWLYCFDRAGCSLYKLGASEFDAMSEVFSVIGSLKLVQSCRAKIQSTSTLSTLTLWRSAHLLRQLMSSLLVWRDTKWRDTKRMQKAVGEPLWLLSQQALCGCVDSWLQSTACSDGADSLLHCTACDTMSWQCAVMQCIHVLSGCWYAQHDIQSNAMQVCQRGQKARCQWIQSIYSVAA